MTAIAQLIIRRSSNEVPIWQTATWEDYLAGCNSSEKYKHDRDGSQKEVLRQLILS